MGADLLGRNLDGNQSRASTEHVLDMRISCLVIVSNVTRGNVIAYYQCTSRTELAPGAARESGHNSMCRKGLKNLARHR